MKKEILEIKKQVGLQKSLKEGLSSSVSTSLGDTYVTPFALTITPSAFQGIVVGLLSSFSMLISQISQYKGSKLMNKYSRKVIVSKSYALQAFVWFFIGILSLLSLEGITAHSLPIILIIAYCIISFIGGLLYPAWFSWLGDLVPEKARGRYFSRRNVLVGIIGIITVSIVGKFLDVMEGVNALALAFSIVFFLTAIFKLVALKFLKEQYEPEVTYKKDKGFSIISFLKRMDNYGKFSVYQAFLNFAIMIASPFFAVYMLEELHLDYIAYSIITISSTIFYLLFLPVAGRFSDKYGNVKLIYVANLFYAINPILWIIIKNPFYLIFIQFAAGIANACMAIAITNFTYASVSPKHRGICVAYTNILVGIGTFLGAILGGALLSYLDISASTFYIVFAIAAAARLIVMLLFLPSLKEKQKGRKLPFIRTIITSPTKLLSMEYHSAHNLVEKEYSQGLKILKPLSNYVLQK